MKQTFYIFLLFLCFDLPSNAQNSYVYIEGIKGIPFNVISDNKEIEKLGQSYAILTFTKPGEKNIDITFANSNFTIQKFIVDVQPNSSYGYRLGKTEENRFYLIDIVNNGSLIETNTAVNLALSTNKNLINTYQPVVVAKENGETNESKIAKNEIDEKENREIEKNRKLLEDKIAKEEIKRLKVIQDRMDEEVKEKEKLLKQQLENERKERIAKEKLLAKQVSDLTKLENRKKDEEMEAIQTKEKQMAKEASNLAKIERKKIEAIEKEKLLKEIQALKNIEDLAKLEKKKDKVRIENEERVAKEAKKENDRLILETALKQKQIEQEKQITAQKSIPIQTIQQPVKYGVVDSIVSKERVTIKSSSNTIEKPQVINKRNSNCTKNASELEIKSMLDKIETKGDDEDKLLYVKKKTLSGCFTSSQIYSIATIFDTQYGRYSLIKFVLPLVSDSVNLISLEDLFKYDNYKSKLRKLIEE